MWSCLLGTALLYKVGHQKAQPETDFNQAARKDTTNRQKTPNSQFQSHTEKSHISYWDSFFKPENASGKLYFLLLYKIYTYKKLLYTFSSTKSCKDTFRSSYIQSHSQASQWLKTDPGKGSFVPKHYLMWLSAAAHPSISAVLLAQQGPTLIVSQRNWCTKEDFPGKAYSRKRICFLFSLVPETVITPESLSVGLAHHPYSGSSRKSGLCSPSLSQARICLRPELLAHWTIIYPFSLPKPKSLRDHQLPQHPTS